VQPEEPDPAVHIVDLNLLEGPLSRKDIQLYYRICKTAPAPLNVTTSCFSVWQQHRRTNGYAKVIPAQKRGTEAPGEQPAWVFFFDDNLEFTGTEDGPGICNLRDASTGEFVDFSEGRNGFRRDYYDRHTVIHHSSLYRSVLVKANILDAIASEDYFADIIRRYTTPNEKLIVFMDVNSTIMCNDTSAGKDIRASLLSVMFELIVVHSPKGVDFAWDAGVQGRVDKPKPLKQLVKELAPGDQRAYCAFWKETTCLRFIEALAPLAELRWTTHGGAVTVDSFRAQFRTCLAEFSDDLLSHGITRSWFNCFQSVQNHGDVVILNSFGVDTRKVVLATVPSERQAMQIVVNHELWESRDVAKFELQYRGQPPQEVPQYSDSTFAGYLFGADRCFARACACK